MSEVSTRVHLFHESKISTELTASPRCVVCFEQLCNRRPPRDRLGRKRARRVVELSSPSGTTQIVLMLSGTFLNRKTTNYCRWQHWEGPRWWTWSNSAARREHLKNAAEKAITYGLCSGYISFAVIYNTHSGLRSSWSWAPAVWYFLPESSLCFAALSSPAPASPQSPYTSIATQSMGQFLIFR